jgi:hypothetical protein
MSQVNAWVPDYWTEAIIMPEPDVGGPITDPVSMAASVIEDITRATTCLRPGTAGQPAHG